MVRKNKPKVVILHPKFLQAMKGFVPIFLNDQDQWILKQIDRHTKRLKEVDNKILRSGEKLTHKMKEILKDEVKLIELIDERNMDF